MKSLFKKCLVSVLTWEAKLVLARYKPHVVAVTGSVGKTSTKDAIFSVLSTEFYVRKSDKSFNSEIGIPLTILGLSNAWSNPFRWIANLVEGFALGMLRAPYPEWLVLEVGADRPGDIRTVAMWLKPDVVVMTHIPPIPVHVEFFPTPEAVAREKRYLAQAVKSDGVLVLNADDERVSTTPHPHKGRVVSYGFAEGADVRVLKHRISYRKGAPIGTTFKVSVSGYEFLAHVQGALGVQHIYPVLASVAVGHALGLPLDAIEEGVGEHETPPGRMKIIQGVSGSTIIDDTYNASPAAVERALETLTSLECSGRKIAVLADMMELGVYSAKAHCEIGKHAAVAVDMLIAVGVRSHATAQAAIEAGLASEAVQEFSTAMDAAAALSLVVSEGDIVLVKGSQSMRMERVVEKLMARPERKEQLLVRQDPFWKAKP